MEFYDFPIILGMSFYPNWRTHSIIFQRGRYTPTTNQTLNPTKSYNITMISELDDGKIYRKPLYLMVKPMVSCRCSFKPIHWYETRHCITMNSPIQSPFRITGSSSWSSGSSTQAISSAQQPQKKSEQNMSPAARRHVTIKKKNAKGGCFGKVDIFWGID